MIDTFESKEICKSLYRALQINKKFSALPSNIKNIYINIY